VIAPPDPVLGLLEAGVRDRGGAALIGTAGVGKTTLARAAADRLGPRHGRFAWVTGTGSRQAIPFAAFADLIEVGETGKTAAVLRAARESLADDLLLVVDDAHLLDPLSATLLHQLAVSAAARLIVTADASGPVPDAVSALWTDGHLARVDVEPPGHDDARQAAQVADFVAALDPVTRWVLEYLAVEDPLPSADLSALASRDAVQRAEAVGVVVIDGAWVRAAHPLYVDALRRQLGGPELRRLRTELVDHLSGSGAGVVDRLRLAVLALESDRLQPVADVIAAAEDALRLGDLPLSERLGRAAAAREPGLAPRLPLAYALAWQSRGREADAVLAEVDPATLSEEELMAWALPRAANQFWMLSEPERATAFLRTARGKVPSPTARITLDALAATFAMNAGSLQRAMELATEVLVSPSADDTAVGWAAAAAALSSARMGRFDDVDELAKRAMAAGHPGLLRFTSGFGQTSRLLMAGELDRAQALGQQLIDFAELQQPGRAIGEILVADVLLARGELAAAVQLLRDAAAVLAPTGYSWGPLAWMLLAQALGQQGATAEAGKVLARAESRHGLKSMLFAPELSLARAWATAARRDEHGAIAAAREAARTAERGGQAAVALRALHDAARLGDVRAVDGIARLGVDCEFGRLALDHARALASGDAAALDQVSAAFAAIGMHTAGADAAEQARKLGLS
jgi:hypothetical protein